ncbi:MAG: hypothetical protein HY709_07675 [Candidatus Latescibacteria bacterium]|nr:hypothetical protein [Candidatus Latescibacterota bacterium]
MVPKPTHATFHIHYIWVALGIAIFAGFAIGAHVAFVIGFDFPLGKGYLSFIQTHGHVQLVGWVGLFIIGITLHFIPRLAGVPIAHPSWIERVLWLMAAGLIVRSIGHTILPYLDGSPFFLLYNWLVAVSGLIEWFGVVGYLLLLLNVLYDAGETTERLALQSVRPFFGMMIVGWVFYASLNLILLVHMAISGQVVVHQAWNEFAIQAFIGLILLPVTFAFSVRLFPLYLRLPASDWPVRGLAYAYLVAFCLSILPTLPVEPITRISLSLSMLGKILRGGIILWFIWKLDVLTRLREPWIVKRVLQPGPERRPTREGMPDYGEFGKFERLVYAAYVWLALGAFLEVMLGVTTFLGWSLSISGDAVRHVYLLGFVTHLILGMSVRMIPGFLGKRRVASQRLVNATFWLGTGAALSRVLPLLVPSRVLEAIPGGVAVSQAAFGLSGILGLAMVSCLAVNLWKTA